MVWCVWSFGSNAMWRTPRGEHSGSPLLNSVVSPAQAASFTPPLWMNRQVAPLFVDL